MLDFEQQANQAQALASLDEDWHLLEGECTTFLIFFSSLSLAFSMKTCDSGVDVIGTHLVKFEPKIDASFTLSSIFISSILTIRNCFSLLNRTEYQSGVICFSSPVSSQTGSTRKDVPERYVLILT